MADGEGANLLGRGGEGFAQGGIDGVPRSGHLFRCDTQFGRIFEAVEFGGVAEQGAVAPLAHIGDDAFDGGQDLVERRAAAMFERSQQFRRLLCSAASGSNDPHDVLRLTARPC